MTPADVEQLTELAPSGRLRAAINLGNAVLAQAGGPQGAKGPSVDIANELGRRLNCPVDLIIYDSAGQVVAGLAGDRWDVAFLAIDPVRADQIAFTMPYVFIEGTYMVKADAPFQTTADLDHKGVRIAVGKGAAYDLHLSRTLRHATLVRSPTSAAAITHFLRDGLEAVGGIRQALLAAEHITPNCRVLVDCFNRIDQAIALPKGRLKADKYLSAVIEELKAKGFVRDALDRAGQSDVSVAPRAQA